MAKMAKNCQKLVMKIFWAPKTPFLYKGFKKLYIQNVGHIWAYIHANSQDFWKSFNGSDKTKCVKNMVKKCPTKIIVLTPFWGTSKNQRLDLKVWADPSWLLVLKNGLKKCSSLTNDWVREVKKQTKKQKTFGWI